jgi:hypothetical protein
MKLREFKDYMDNGHTKADHELTPGQLNLRKHEAAEDERKSQEEDADHRALMELSAAIERHPIQSPRIRRG